MFNSSNETVTGEDVINNLIASYYEIEPYTGESDIIHELKKALNGEDSFGFQEHSITVSPSEGQIISQMMKNNAKSIFKWPRHTKIDWALTTVRERSKTVHDEILALVGPSEFVYRLRVSEKERNKEWVLLLVTINAAKIAHYSKNRTLGEATLLYGFFECLRSMKLNWVNRELNLPSGS